MTRRNLLLLTLVWTLRSRSPASRREERAARSPLCASEALLDALGSRPSARVIGCAYLAEHPEERDRKRLLRELDLDVAGAETSRLREMLVQRQLRDFAFGRVVRVDGWILSETEARLCALAAV